MATIDTTGARNGAWNGGRRVTAAGYVEVYAPTHPHATGRGVVTEHRLVMEEVLGRFLDSTESVHHRNGVKADNRRENLELWVRSQPAGQRAVDLVAWAREILDRYEGEAPLLVFNPEGVPAAAG